MADHEVVIVGAGFGGMGAAISSAAGLSTADVEREDDLGGTWHVNRYPGLAVDIATVTYSYSFAPNPTGRLFATGPELKEYAEQVADRYALRPHMRFNGRQGPGGTKTSHWTISIVGDQRRRNDRHAREIVPATGYLSRPKRPKIAGINDFAAK